METSEGYYKPVEPEVLDAFKPGVYLHYKGNLYESQCLGLDSNFSNRVVVIYKSLAPKAGEAETTTNYIRSLTSDQDDSWTDTVHRNGNKCGNLTECQKNGVESAPRFRYLGPELEEWMLKIDPWSVD